MPKKPQRPKPPLTIQQLAERRYADPQLAARVAKDATDNGTAERIEDGELVLPSEADARRHFARVDEEAANAEEDK